jgi:uncharacterized protein (DUF3084 family)
MIVKMDALQASVHEGESQAKEQVRQQDGIEEKLQEARAREQQYTEREKEFSALAQETTRELDTVISQVLHALGDED